MSRIVNNKIADNEMVNNEVADSRIADNGIADNGIVNNGMADNRIADNGLVNSGMAMNRAAGSRIIFRRMVQEDADGVAMVEAACMPVPWSRQSFWEEASHSNAYYLLAVDAEKENLIVAYAGCWVLANEGHITNVAVAPSYQGIGLGRRLMNELMGRVKPLGVDSMTLEVRPSNYRAISLYTSLGFKSVGQRPKYYTNPVEAAEIMWNTHI